VTKLTIPEHDSQVDKLQMRLKPSARLQRFLGRELIADPNLAILEFVKNAYDAGAKNVSVRFNLKDSPKSVSISDDGIGMDEDAFRFNWLRPGFSQKSVDYRGDAPPTAVDAAARRLAASRKPAGEKGLGRLSAGRLGERMIVWTRPAENVQWLRVEFDWSRFDDMYTSIDEIDIPFEFRDEAPSEAKKSGTLIEIVGLTQTWTGRIPGRPAPGRPRTRLGRLKQDLSFLIRAQDASKKKFALELDSDVVSESSDIGTVSYESSRLATAQYVYKFDVSLTKIQDGPDELVVTRSIQRNAEVTRTTGRPSVENPPFDSSSAVSDEKWPGRFTGYFLYTPPPAGRRAQEIDLAPTGVLLYRDNVLVEPYGLAGNDWLGVEARKASRQGHAAIQPSTFSGEVEISRATNPELVDMSNRLGLLENDRSEEFVRLVRQEFSFFEEIIYQEVLREGNWQGKSQERAAKQAGLAEQVAQLRLKSLAHRAGQPLQAIGFDVLGLQTTAEDPRIPEELRGRIAAYVQKLEANVERLSKIVRELTSQPALESSEFDISELVEHVANESTGLAEQHRVQIFTTGSASRPVFASKELSFEVIQELVTNAIEATRVSQSVGLVQIEVEQLRPDFVQVRVIDDATGFGTQAGLIKSLEKIGSTKGRPAGGLITAENSMIAMRGNLSVEETSSSGTTIAIRLPTGATPVPSF
jgi:signal transduction histidine kinase